MKKTIKRAILILLIMMFYIPIRLMADTGFGDNTEDTPFDGGVSLLIAAGIAYGLKKARDNKKRKDYRED